MAFAATGLIPGLVVHFVPALAEAADDFYGQENELVGAFLRGVEEEGKHFSFAALDGGDGDIGADAQFAVFVGFHLQQSGDLADGASGFWDIAQGAKFTADGELVGGIPFVAF